MSAKKILIVQIFNRNFGDMVIADNVKKVIKDVIRARENEFVLLDYDIASNDLGQIKYSDAVFFVGGGIVKYKYEEFDKNIIAIINECEKQDVPVYFNSVGIEGYDEDNERCQSLKIALNKDNVKGISVRDDVRLLKKSYIINQNIRVQEVFDTAIFSKDTYGILNSARKDVVGLGIARDRLYLDNGSKKVDREYLIKFWCEVIDELEKRNMEYEVFTNGLASDETFAKEILKISGSNKKINPPYDGEELVRNITSYKAIIACRMHSNIIAYAYKIPSVGLVWNDKLRFFGEKTGYQERFVEEKDLNAKHCVNILLKAIDEGVCGPSEMEKEKIIKEIYWFLDNCVIKNNKTKAFDFSKHMVATATGAVANRYRNMNTIEGLDYSIKNGYKYIEIDIAKTSDDKLVCLNGFNKNSYTKLGKESEKDRYLPFSYNEFKSCRYFGKFATISVKEIFEYFQEIKLYDKITLIFDFTNMNEVTESDVKEINKLIAQYNISNENMFIFKEKIIESDAVNCYYLDKLENLETDIMYMKQMRVEYVVIPEKIYSCDLVEEFTRNEISVMVLSTMKSANITDMVENGVKLVGSYSYTPKHMNLLTNS